jgi:hypothetical protein
MNANPPPLAGAFDVYKNDTMGASYVSILGLVAISASTTTTGEMPNPDAAGELPQSNEVYETHEDVEHSTSLKRIVGDESIIPKLKPAAVIAAPPEVGEFDADGKCEEIGASKENASRTAPLAFRSRTRSSRAPPPVPNTAQVMVVRDTHELHAQSASPIIADGLRSFSINDQPLIVTVLPPEAGPFTTSLPRGGTSPKAS